MGLDAVADQLSDAVQACIRPFELATTPFAALSHCLVKSTCTTLLKADVSVRLVKALRTNLLASLDSEQTAGKNKVKCVDRVL